MGCQHKSLKSELFVHFSPPFTCPKFRLRNSAIASICRVSCHGGLTFCHQLFLEIPVATLPEISEKPAIKRYPPYPPHQNSRVFILSFSASKRRHRDLGKMHFSSNPPFFSALLLPAKIRRSFRGIKREKKNI